MKQIVSNYSYSPTTNVVTLTGVNIDQDQLLLIAAPQVGRTMYNFASGVTGVVSAGANTRVTLNASTAGLTTTSPLVIFYDDHTSTQTVAGTVTANDSAALTIVNSSTVTKADVKFTAIAGAYNATDFAGSYTLHPINVDNDGIIFVDGQYVNYRGTCVTYNPSSSETAWKAKLVESSVTVGNSVTIGSLPAISGTVTVGGFSSVSVGSGAVLFGGLRSGIVTPIPLETSSGFLGAQLVQSTGAAMGPINASNRLPVTAQLQDGSGNNLTSTSIGGVQRLNVSLASAATPGGSIPTFVNVYGGSDSGTVRALAVDSSGRTVVTVSNFPATQAVSLASTTVTVSSLPSGALTTRFGSVTTANTAQITSAVTNTSRKYLLAQNISAGTVTIGIGFSPTTTQGIQLTAGGGLTFDTFCPTGAVYWLGAVTGAAFTILEG